jgi:hypothetical protein
MLDPSDVPEACNELGRVEELRADIERISRDIEALFHGGDESTLTQRDK